MKVSLIASNQKFLAVGIKFKHWRLALFQTKASTFRNNCLYFNLWNRYESQDIYEILFKFWFLTIGQGGDRFIYKPYKYPDKNREIVQDATGRFYYFILPWFRQIISFFHPPGQFIFIFFILHYVLKFSWNISSFIKINWGI